MRVPTTTRRRTIGAAAVLTAAVSASILVSSLSPISAGAAAAPTRAAAEPSVTPLAAALVPAPIDVDRRAPSNVVTVQIVFKPGQTTGWHSHPGAVFVQVASGAVTLRHAAHGQCLSDVVRAGHGFFEKPGAVHEASNNRHDRAVLYATFVLPVGAPPEVVAPVPAACH